MGLDKNWEENPEWKAAVDKAKNFPRKTGRPAKEFGPVISIACKVLHDAGLSMADIASELKVNPATVAKILKRRNIADIDSSDMAKVKEQFSSNIVNIVNKMLLSADTHGYVENLAQSRNPGLIQAISILIEKLNLLQGKPTNILDVRDTAKMVDDKMKEITDLEEALRKSITLSEDPKAN